MNRSKLLLTLSLGVVSIAWTACSEEVAAPVDLARPVVVTPVTITDLEDRIEATGELFAKDEAEIAAEVAGRVTEILVFEGEQVEAGQTLLTIDPETRRLELDSARARLAEVRADLEEQEREERRVTTLFEKGISSEAALDKAKTGRALAVSRVAAARAQVGVASRALDDANVTAPFSGVVARREVSRGEFVSVGRVLAQIVALDPIEVEFNLAERDSARVQTGMRVGIEVAPYPGERFEGTVTVVSPTIDVATRTLRVKAQVPNPDGRLRPGLFASTDLGISTRPDVLLVPEPSVLLRAQGQVVYVVGEDDVARRVLVETGVHKDGMVEVRSGLAAGDEVIVRGHAALADGSPVSRRLPDGSEDHSQVNVATGVGETETAVQ